MDEKIRIKLTIEPWNTSLEERIKSFHKAKEEGKKVALYFVKGPDSSTFRYRCYNVHQITKKSKEWFAVCFYRWEVKTVKELLPRSNLLVLGRQSRWDSLIKGLIEQAHTNNIPVLFDLDDLVFDKKYLGLVLNTIGEAQNIDYWAPYFDDIHLTGEKVDGFLVTNNFLGEKIQQTFKKPYKIIMNSLNKEQITASDVYLGLGVKKGRNSFDIGYFSGSPTHVNDLEVALPELLAFLENHESACLKVVGLMDFDERTTRFVEQGKIKIVPPVDFRKLQREMCEVDVNVAPLTINDFTNCKSELKFFEAAAVETVTIASPTYTFKKAITNDVNGYLAWPGEWYEKLDYLYAHPNKRNEVAKAARNYALNNYCGDKFLKEVESAFNYFA